MTNPKQSRTRLQIREAIGYNLGCLIAGTASSAGTTATLVDTYGLAIGGDDEYNGSQILITDASGSIVDGEKSFVSDYTATSHTATVAPVFSAATASGDEYELWRSPYTVEQVHSVIDDSIIAASDDCMQDKQVTTTFTERDKDVYALDSAFKAIASVEYVTDINDYQDIDTCNALWDNTVTGVTGTLDTEIYRTGGACNKFVVAASASTGLLCSNDIGSIDISNCDQVELWLYSTVALTAGYLTLQLDDTSQCASAIESINIPATTAKTWTRHILTLASPLSDTDIISVGINMATDVGAFTLYIDEIKAIKSTSKEWERLPYDQWSLVKGSTNYLQLTPVGKYNVGYTTQLRINGYELPDVMDADSDACEVDPDYVVLRSTGKLLLALGRQKEIDPKARIELAKYYLGEAEERLAGVRTMVSNGTRWL